MVVKVGRHVLMNDVRLSVVHEILEVRAHDVLHLNRGQRGRHQFLHWWLGLPNSNRSMVAGVSHLTAHYLT